MADKPAVEMTDDELAQEIMDQVRMSRLKSDDLPENHPFRVRTRELAAEARKRKLLNSLN